MIGRGSMVLIKNTRENGRVAEITSEEICTVIVEGSNCCRIINVNELEKI